MKKALVLLADGCEEIEAVTPIDLLRRAGVTVVVAGVGGRDVVGAHHIRLSADTLVDEVEDEFDAIVIPGGMPGASNIAGSPEARALIQTQHARSRVLAAICAAPAIVLAPLGILEGRLFTCYPGMEGDVRGARWSDDRVVVDGHLVTSRGPGTAAEFALAVIGAVAGLETAGKVAATTLAR